MKILVCIGIALVGILSQSCDNDSPELYTLEQKFTISEDEAIKLQLPSDTGYLDVQIINVSESRCPSDVTCIRAGEVEVRAAVTGLQETATLVDLCIGDCLKRKGGFLETDTVEVQLDNKVYAVILLDVLPFPTTSNQTAKKEVCLKIISL